MNQFSLDGIARLPNSFVIQVVGNDATKVVNNLCTNDIARLSIGASLETFVTDLRGWVVAHAAVFKQSDRLWLVGSHASPSKICNHIDRYIIREDAQIHDLSSSHAVLVLAGEATNRDAAQDADDVAQHSYLSAGLPISDAWPEVELDCHLPVLSRQGRGLVGGQQRVDALIQACMSSQVHVCSPQEFEWRRIANFWPLSSHDFGEKAIPQELDRDAWAISFTKGCYLGQETIARLDARGQLQKKLCQLELHAVDQASGVAIGASLFHGEKEAGQLTSLARDPHAPRWLGMAMLRRGSFAVGTQLACGGLTAQVMATS